MKKLLVVLLSLMMVLSFAGCEKKPEPVEKAEVVIWHSFTAAQKDQLEKAIAEFNASQDVYTVKAESQPKDGLSNKVYQAVSAGNGPDMFFEYASTAAKFTDDKKVADLSKYLKAETVALLPEKVKAEATSFKDGGMYVFPMVSSGPIMFYNKPLFEELGLTAPQTWEELIDACRKIKAARPDMIGAFAVDSRIDIGNTLIYQTGNGLYDPSKNEVLFNTPEVAAQLKMWQDCFNEGLFCNVSGLNDGYCSSAFNKEQIACFIGSAAGVPYVGPAKGGPEFGFGIVPQGGAVKWTPAWNRGMIVFNYGNEAKVKACAAFIEFFATPEQNAAWCIACNYPAMFASTMENAAYKEFAAKNESFGYLQPEIGGAAPAEGNSVMRNTVDHLLAAVEGGTDIQKALDDAVKEAKEELAAQ